ncbi:unnamed protein product [Bursaphelenchus okinawaensis]|uniref:Protein kinase domain-containing protein n=1 Tax=Bursaphelenchus okinawaensis TaxID=465554 RepID=A0A811KR08_9BILA|nr:unnamed protein product [Bursaphelenchus okinawaensis]CAG9111102.1 unnamed protein product [Bursaphelenchus okinawaensis]
MQICGQRASRWKFDVALVPIAFSPLSAKTGLNLLSLIFTINADLNYQRAVEKHRRSRSLSVQRLYKWCSKRLSSNKSSKKGNDPKPETSTMAEVAPAPAAAAPTKGDRLPQSGETVKSDSNKTYNLKKILGEGGYGTVYEASDIDSRSYALKAEKWSKTVLKIEIGVLKATNARSCRHFCTIYDVGRCSPDYMFIVVTLLGPDIARLRNDQPDRKFSIGTALRVGMQTSAAIEELHRTGFISRDVKPGNFAIGNKDEDQHRIVYMFDFGLSRRYVDKNFNVLPPRKDPGWRGTTRYGSLQAHQKLDLGRKDDFESWLYMLVEITKGSLPWRMVTDRAKVQDSKTSARTTARASFFAGCPKQYDKLMDMIDKLAFDSTPPYSDFQKVLLEGCEENKIPIGSKYDWEGDCTSSIHTSVTKSLDKSPSDQQRANNQERPTKLDV